MLDGPLVGESGQTVSVLGDQGAGGFHIFNRLGDGRAQVLVAIGGDQNVVFDADADAA
jgi:hypothetical protein